MTRSSRVGLVMLASGLLTASCARARSDKGNSSVPAGDATPTPSETVLTGKVAAVGLAVSPSTLLQVEGGRPTTLVGPLEPELRRLGGATVWVAGDPVTGPPNATFRVTRYDILSIDGAKPLVGRVVTRDGAPWLATDRDTVRLETAPAELAAQTGAKVWVIGRRTGAELTTQSYGVIRDP